MNEGSNYLVLIVDDNTAIHDDFRKILSRSAIPSSLDETEANLFGAPLPGLRHPTFELSYASQGQEALRLVEDQLQIGHRFSLVFMDVRMPPGWDGIKTAVKLWEI